MPVQIVITGEHATDAIAELLNLSDALNGPKKETIVVHSTGKLGPSGSQPVNTDQIDKIVETVEKQVEEKSKVSPKETKLTRTEQEKAMKEMIEAGEKDDRFDLLTQGRQNKVEKALEDEAQVEAGNDAEIKEEAAQDDFDDMFDDDADDTLTKEITGDDIREMMAAKGKDKDGNPIQENLLNIREILTAHVPKGADVKVGNIPADKLASAYAALKAL